MDHCAAFDAIHRAPPCADDRAACAKRAIELLIPWTWIVILLVLTRLGYIACADAVGLLLAQIVLLLFILMDLS